ncbi:MAG: double zinc ribbon domain-containing protein [Anaerolineae bacterium]
MERQFFHGAITPEHVAQALLAEFNRGNLRAQVLRQEDQTIVQIATRPDATAGGQTALTVRLQTIEDGILVEMGQQTWLGVAASLGQTAFWALRNPLALLSRLDDLAQDIENLQLGERVWATIEKTAQAMGASRTLSERLKRLTCEYCGSANPVGEATCVACGAPLGNVQPRTCPACGFVLLRQEKICPNCGQSLSSP